MIDWGPLEAEIDLLDMPLSVWWRDDDAITDTPALDRLIRLAELHGWPLHLAIVPAHADPLLARRIRNAHSVIPLTHGWAHISHAPSTEKNSEFGAHRPLEVMADEARQGRERLAGLLGEETAPMFVPPWNRVTPNLLPLLPDYGFHTISTFNPREAPLACPGLLRVNTHLDPINWRGGRSVVDPQVLVNQMAHDLSDRRLGRADPQEPYGLLTHHLVHDDAIWHFIEDFLTRLSRARLYFWTAHDRNPETIT